MARMTTRQRRAIPKRDFAGAGRSFPIFDPKHARLAIGAATRSYHAGNISRSEMQSIQRKARAKLRNSRRGRR